jgi:cytosine deaminase
LWEVGIQDGRILSVSKGTNMKAETVVDAGGRLLTTGFANIHLHLDKCLTTAWSKTETGVNAGSPDVIPAATDVKRRFTEDDIIARATEAVKTSVRAGTTAIRGFADVDTVGGLLAVKSLAKVKQRFQGVVDLQVCAFPQEGITRDPGTEELMHKSMEIGADVVGGIPWYEKDPDARKRHIDTVFEIAKRYDKDVHMLVDDTADPAARNVEYLASKTIQEGYQGRVAASHCRGGLDSSDVVYANRVVALAREAGLTVVENPHLSLFMYGRGENHPIRRGLTRIREFLDGDVNIAIGQDDIDDPYYPFGRGDMLELAFMMVHAAQLTTMEELEQAFDMVTRNPARAMRISGYGLEQGKSADLVLLDARSVHEALRLQPDRLMVMKAGKVVAETKTSAKLNF